MSDWIVVDRSLLVLAGIGCLCFPVPVTSQFEAPYSADVPEFAWVLDSMTAALGIPPLRSVTLPEGHRELRLWWGFGPTVQMDFLRLMETPDTVIGEMYVWGFELDSSSDESELPLDHWAREYGCRAVRLAGRRAICRVHFDRPPDWRAVAGQLDSLDAWQLPEPDTLGPTVLGFDGYSLVGEARRWKEYRTYEYWSPDHDEGVYAGKAAELIRLIRRTRRRATR